MAISPDEAGEVTQDEIKTVAEAERKVDAYLRKRYQGSGNVQITDPINKLSERCRKELLRRYRAAGWTIEQKRNPGCSDPREPTPSYNYWVFKRDSRIVAGRYGYGEQITNPTPPPWMDR